MNKNMFRLLQKLPPKCWVAVSGGPDSMAGLHWLRQGVSGQRVKGIIHVNYSLIEADHQLAEIVKNYAKIHNIPARIYNEDGTVPRGESPENHWRNIRYNIFSSYEDTVVTCHNLDDCAEQYVINTLMCGQPTRRLIPSSNGNVVRPFLCWKKSDMREYCIKNDIPFMDDPLNQSTTLLRARVRHKIIPEIFAINPGFYNHVQAQVIEQSKREPKKTH